MALQKIAICGSPHSGKTTISIKLAKLLKKKFKSPVVVVFSQDKGSPLTYAFLKKEEEGDSLGRLITQPNVTQQDIINAILLPKSEDDVGFLGYQIEESFQSYPRIDDSQVEYFYKVLNGVADYIIVDIDNDFDTNPISRMALRQFDTIIYVSAADVPSLAYYKSAIPLIDSMTASGPDCIILNDVKAYGGLAVIKEQMGSVDYILPYDVNLLEQSLEGRMIENTKSNKRKQNINYILNEMINDIIVQV